MHRGYPVVPNKRDGGGEHMRRVFGFRLNVADAKTKIDHEIVRYQK